MKRAYTYLNHTADLGIVVHGTTLKNLFIHIGKAIFETQLSGPISIRHKKTIELKAETHGDLFIGWCRELLYNFSVHGFIPGTYEVSIKNNMLKARLSGDRFNPRKHKVRMEIKNPTYHHFSLRKTPKGYRATIIFDV